MADRSGDWMAQAEDDLEAAEILRNAGKHAQACFMAQQAAEKAVKAAHLSRLHEYHIHVVQELLKRLDVVVPTDLLEKGAALDSYYVPTRYANGHAEGARFGTTLACRARTPSPMPMRSLNSPVLIWPSRAEVIAGVRQWVERQRAKHPELVRAGYFGSLNDGVRYGVGSDADVVFVVTHASREHWYQRPLDFDSPGDEVPVDVDLFVYTEDEFARILARGDLFARDLQNVVWL